MRRWPIGTYLGKRYDATFRLCSVGIHDSRYGMCLLLPFKFQARPQVSVRSEESDSATVFCVPGDSESV